jgi:hypothetical protein
MHIQWKTIFFYSFIFYLFTFFEMMCAQAIMIHMNWWAVVGLYAFSCQSSADQNLIKYSGVAKAKMKYRHQFRRGIWGPPKAPSGSKVPWWGGGGVRGGGGEASDGKRISCFRDHLGTNFRHMSYIKLWVLFYDFFFLRKTAKTFGDGGDKTI